MKWTINEINLRYHNYTQSTQITLHTFYIYYSTRKVHSNITPEGYILLYKINKKQSEVISEGESREDC